MEEDAQTLATRVASEDPSEGLRAVESRLRSPSWDVCEPFMARRGRALRDEATVRFARALYALHALLAGLTDTSVADARGPRSPVARRLLAQIRQELRYLQRAFDGGSLLLANALETYRV